MAIRLTDIGSPIEKAQVSLEDIESLTAEQVIRHIDEKKANGPCEACGATDWEIDRNGEKIAFTLSPLSTDQDAGLVMLPLTCVKCGNVRYLNAAYIAKMILKRGV